MKTAFQAEKADGLDATYELRLVELPFSIAVKGGRFEAERGEPDRPDATIRSDPSTIAGIVFGEKRLGKAVDAGEIEVDGSRRAVNALFRSLG